MASVEEIIAEEWRSRAAELADWAMDRLINRLDVWGQYAVLTPEEQRTGKRSYKAMTLPAVAQRDTGEERVTIDKLTRHFASRRGHRPQLIGLHARSQSGTSRWFGVDVDNHADNASKRDDLARRNLNAVLGWYRSLQKLGYDPLLFDSNGVGGYHLWVLFAEPAPTTDVREFAVALVSDWESRQLERRPEVFPKRVRPESLGAWFRLPGLHHTRAHHSRVWSGDDDLDDHWLSGNAAIDAMLACVPGPPPPPASTASDPGSIPDSIPDSMLTRADAGAARRKPLRRDSGVEDARPGDTVRQAGRRSFARSGRATVCVDLDGVLAHRSGDGRLGSPIDGAVEFTRELHASFDVVIYTSRFTTRDGRPRSAGAVDTLEKRIARWLDVHGFAWDRINTEAAKPLASAYVDDRAVPCRPEDDGLAAFGRALETVRILSNGESG